VYAFSANRIEQTQHESLAWDTDLQANFLGLLILKPAQMAMVDLYHYMQYLQSNHQKTITYQLALWHKIFYPLAAVVMALLALAFVSPNKRNAEMGSKLFLGILLGVCFHFLNSFFNNLAIQGEWHPAIPSLLPSLLFLSIGIMIIIRQERR
jgi:lipopolysaccharide export system permease protein